MVGPSKTLVDGCFKEISIYRNRKRGINSKRNHCDLFQYALSNEDEAVVISILGDFDVFVQEWWASIQVLCGLNPVGYVQLGFTKKWVLMKLEDRLSKNGDNHILHPGSVGAPARPEQNKFMRNIRAAYDGVCAITGAVENLEAAHIFQLASGGDYSIGNGVLLTKEMHRHFDRYRFTFTPEFIVKVNPRHEELLIYAEKHIRLPKDQKLWPSIENILWHNNRCRKWVLS